MTPHTFIHPYSTASRWLALTCASWSAMLALFSEGSVAARAAGEDGIALALNAALFMLSVVGWVDVVVHDFGKRLILPSIPDDVRHRICVIVYASMAGIFGIRAFAVADLEAVDRVLITGYYLAIAIGIAILSVALAVEDRKT